jgi:hypothetical protein
VEAKLAYADAKGEIRVHALESGEEHLLAGHWMMETPGRPDHQARLRWPTWSPNGNRIAVEGLSVSETGIDRALLWIVSADGIRAEAVEELPPAGLVYLQWQPDGAGLLHLTAIGEGRLRLARAGSSTSIAEGAPLFLSALAGGKVAAHVFAGATLVFTVRETDHERLAIWGPERGYEELPVAVQGRVALLPEASGSVLVASGPASEAEYQRLERLQGPPWHTEPLLQTPFSAVFPLPDGRVGFVTAEDSGAFSWRLLEGRERSPFELLRFVPTEEETLRLGFFDQYHGSHSPIAPDGHALVVAGVNVRAPSLPGEPQLYCVPLDGSGNPRALGAGRFAVWAPGPTGGALGPPTS